MWESENGNIKYEKKNISNLKKQNSNFEYKKTIFSICDFCSQHIEHFEIFDIFDMFDILIFSYQKKYELISVGS